MKDYRKLVVWERAHKLVLCIYELTRSFPSEERYGLTSQLRRAASSTPTNIAEGCGRYSQSEFANFLQFAFGSLQEVDYLAFLSYELKYIDQTIYSALDKDINALKAMLITLIQKVRKANSAAI